MAPEQAAAAEQADAKQGGLLKIALLGGIVILALLLAFSGWYVFGREPVAEDAQAEPQLVDANKVGDFWPPTTKDQQGLSVTGNLAGQDSAIHFLATVQLELGYFREDRLRTEALAEMDSLRPWVADVCRRKIGTRTESQVHNEAEEQRIKQDIIQMLNQRLQIARVKDVCFVELVTQ